MENILNIQGARQHNLKNISLILPKNRLIVFTGVSGSGKSSLAFDTLYAEGQRRYVESLSSYARQFLGVMDKPDVDRIDGLCPSISIDQKSASHNPRSTVGTVTEIYDYIRLLFARIGRPHCPSCGREIQKLSSEQICSMILSRIQDISMHSDKHTHYFFILSPIIRDKKGEFTGLFDNLRAKGYTQVRIDGHYYQIHEDFVLIKTNKHSVEVVIDKISITKKIIRNSVSFSTLRRRIADSVEQALGLSLGYVLFCEILDASLEIPKRPKRTKDLLFSEHSSCPACSISLPEIEPRTFSFNSPHGACPDCSGLGTIATVDPQLVLNMELSISEGAIIPFAKMFFHDTWFSRIILAVCDVHSIRTKVPVKALTLSERAILLYGTDNQIYEVHGPNRSGEMTSIQESFCGIIAELKRRYAQTHSEFIRHEIEKFIREEPCTMCHGARLKKESLTITIYGKSIAYVTGLSVSDATEWFTETFAEPHTSLNNEQSIIAAPIVKEILARLAFLSDVGLEYLTLERPASTLSGGESQRIRLASQIGSGLSGVLYILDEPSIGLHQKDNWKLITTLKHLRDEGNTVIVVEHDREMMEQADYIVDFGPGAGGHGGEIIAYGPHTVIQKHSESLTGQYLSYKRKILRKNSVHIHCEQDTTRILQMTHVQHNNLKNVTLSVPIGKFVCITGVSGSGKSSLIADTLYRALMRNFNPFYKLKPGLYEKITGMEYIDKVILIDQSPIGRTPRSNPATYTGVFTPIREVYAMLPKSREHGYESGRFSFNVKGGRCEACEGEGQKKIEMQFLSDVFVTCDVCKGTRYNADTLEVALHGKTISDILNMTIDEAMVFFHAYPCISEKLKTIHDVGLGYIHLGQPATTLSGGEAQRIKIATELSKKTAGKTLYILDEPTTGLHFADLDRLLHVLDRLTSYGNTVIVIEHNLDMIKNADWIVDMGPDGGDRGGFIVAEGTVKQIMQTPESYTGQCLKNSI